MDMQLNWLWLKSKLFPKNRHLEPVAREANEQAIQKASEIMDRLRGRLMHECLSDTELAAYTAEQGEFLKVLEAMFLWGFFREHVKNYALPTKELDRVILHLADWIMQTRGLSLREAIAKAKEYEDLYNKADPVFDAISELGSTAYHNGSDHALAHCLRAFSNQKKQSAAAR